MFAQAIVMIDFETSGMSPLQGGRVTEVAALRIEGGAITDRFVSLINCGVRIPGFITELTGITQRMVDRAPPVSEVMPALLDFIGNDSLAAHNASFDEQFLKVESDRLGMRTAHDGLICSVKLARRVYPGLPSYSLGKLARLLDIRFQGAAHRAEADAEVSAQLMLKIASELCERHQVDAIDPQLCVRLNQLTAAKVPGFLKQYFETQRNAHV